MKKYFLTNSLAVNPAFSVKLADLNYNESSNRMDDRGSLFVAPVSQTGWDAPVGLLALFASTNGDPIYLAQIEEDSLIWVDGNDADVFPEHMRFPLENASWVDVANDDAAELLEFVRNQIPVKQDE
jgi:hypothetical protein